MFLALAAAQGGGAEGPWPVELNQAVSHSFRIAGEAEDCLARPGGAQLIAERVRALGLVEGPRSEQSRRVIRMVSEPRPVGDRLVYHYLSIGAALCTPFGEANYPCLSVYSARVEAPVAPGGGPDMRLAINDPDRTTVALVEAARDLARTCGHQPSPEDPW